MKTHRKLFATLATATLVAVAACAATTSSAADATWHPLAAGEYHHVYETSFTPSVPATTADPRAGIDKFLSYEFPMAQETWFGRTGHGMDIRITGGTGDPAVFPTFQRDKNGNFTGGMGPSVSNLHPVISYENSYRYPDTVSVTNRMSPTTGHIRERFWGRTPGGFVKLRQFAGTLPAIGTYNRLNQTQIRTWGASLAKLEALDKAATAHARALALHAVLTERGEFGPTPLYGAPSQFGIKLDDALREMQLQRAVKLLSDAPLSPRSRQLLIGWLTRQPGAHVTAGVTDRAGRTGTRITFDRGINRNVGKRVVSGRRLFRESAMVGLIQTSGTILKGNDTVTVPPHHEYRRFYLSAIVNRTTGELLQQSYYERYANSVGLAAINVSHPKHAKHPIATLTRGRRILQIHALGAWDGELVTTDRATSFTPRAAVCLDHPEVCE
jgi:hypothetical protein